MTDRRWRVLYFVSSFPHHESDLEDPWQGELVRRLAAHCELTILAPAFRGSRDHYWHGIPVHRFRYLPAAWENLTHGGGASVKGRTFLGKLKSVAYLIAGRRALRRALQSGDYDVLHLHWPVPHACFYWPRRAPRPRVVLLFYGVELALAKRFAWARAILRWSLRTADAVIAISDYTARGLAGYGAREVAIIPFGHSAGAPLPRAATETRTILFVGRLVPRKGVSVLLHAFAEFRKRHPKWRLRIVGDGPARDLLQELSRQLGLAPAVVFAGQLSADQLRAAYAAATVFVLPSVPDDAGETEGLGVVLLEAMANRVPVIASRTGGILDIVRDEETGLLVTPGDPAALAAALDRLAGDPPLRERLVTNAARLVAERFDWDRIVARVLEVYRGRS